MIEGVSKNDGMFYNLLGEWQGLGYRDFFLVCTVCAIPGMILLYWVAPWNEKDAEAK